MESYNEMCVLDTPCLHWNCIVPPFVQCKLTASRFWKAKTCPFISLYISNSDIASLLNDSWTLCCNSLRSLTGDLGCKNSEKKTNKQRKQPRVGFAAVPRNKFGKFIQFTQRRKSLKREKKIKRFWRPSKRSAVRTPLGQPPRSDTRSQLRTR